MKTIEFEGKKYEVGDWVVIDGGKKAHRLVQSYNGLTAACKKTISGYSTVVEQEQMASGDGIDKCRVCSKPANC